MSGTAYEHVASSVILCKGVLQAAVCCVRGLSPQQEAGRHPSDESSVLSLATLAVLCASLDGRRKEGM